MQKENTESNEISVSEDSHQVSSGHIKVESVAAGVSTFVIAYAIHKVFAPARIATTLFTTPIIVKKLRSIGFLKVPKR